eukprot:SAG31_NODE_5343_length_2596_cov_4.210653_3_plen_68_part_00
MNAFMDASLQASPLLILTKGVLNYSSTPNVLGVHTLGRDSGMRWEPEGRFYRYLEVLASATAKQGQL